MGKVEQLVSYFLFPVLLFHAIVKTPSNLGSASSLIGAGWALCATGIALAYALPHLPWLKTHIDSCQHTACAQIAFRFISFFALALALAERLAGAKGLALIAILLEVRVPVLNVAAVWPMTRHANHQIGRTLIANPLILATLSGMLANLAGFSIPD